MCKTAKGSDVAAGAQDVANARKLWAYNKSGTFLHFHLAFCPAQIQLPTLSLSDFPAGILHPIHIPSECGLDGLITYNPRAMVNTPH